MSIPSDADRKNRRVLGILVGIVASLVATCFAVATRW
jgi:hypothetical protein